LKKGTLVDAVSRRIRQVLDDRKDLPPVEATMREESFDELRPHENCRFTIGPGNMIAESLLALSPKPIVVASPQRLATAATRNGTGPRIQLSRSPCLPNLPIPA